MARKEEKEGEGDYEFRAPEFNEDEFIHKEMVSFRTTAILFVWGVIVAAVSWGVFGAVGGERNGWFAGLALAAAGGYALKWLFPRFKADIRHFKRREWTGTGFLFFFTWLAFFILLINPPVSDFAEPTVEAFPSPLVQQSGGVTTLHIFATDNDRVEEVDFAFWLADRDHPIAAGRENLTALGHGHYTYEVPVGLAAGTYRFSADATDAKGKTTHTEGDLAITGGAVGYYPPDGDAFNSPTDQLAVKLHDDLVPCKSRRGLVTGPDGCVRDVRLALSGGGAVHLRWSDDADAWSALASFDGWASGPNTFRIEAETADHFEGSQRVEGGLLTLPGPFTVDVQVPAGGTAVKVPADPDAPSVNIPGFGAAALLVAIAAAAMLARRR
ncbi:MAG TPA: hypothetical protein VI796_00615 [Candidatus Thermoplasmatota archaeon]|nr:hypothetical protein [Candidatus Thermoplasmatota archaeon]